MIAASALALLALADLASLEKKLKASEERDRSEAVEELARLADPKAWDLVIGALADPSPRVADAAETWLASLRDARLWKELLGKRGIDSPNEWIGIRVAGAIGRTEVGLDGADLAGALDAKEPETRRRLFAALEERARLGRFADDAGTKKLAAALAAQRKREKDPELAAWCWIVASELPGFEPAGLDFKAMFEGPAPMQIALAEISASPSARDDVLVSSAGAALAVSPHRATRWDVVDLFAAREDATAAQELVGMLASETNARLRDRIAEVLERWSGVASGANVDAWKDWAGKLQSDWKPAKTSTDAGAKDAAERKPAGETAQFVGAPIASSALVILVDFSGSLWTPRDDGKTPKELVDAELSKTLQGLKPDTLFNVIPYTDVPIPWEKSVQPATKANVERALKFFSGCKARGKGAFWEAATKALEDPKIDTILVLTDGAPTGGRRWHIDRTREHFVAVNRFRHVALDVLLVGASKRLKEMWTEFARSAGGRSREVKL